MNKGEKFRNSLNGKQQSTEFRSPWFERDGNLRGKIWVSRPSNRKRDAMAEADLTKSRQENKIKRTGWWLLQSLQRKKTENRREMTPSKRKERWRKAKSNFQPKNFPIDDTEDLDFTKKIMLYI